MRFTRAALSGLAFAFVALATPAEAFTAIDPLTRQPLYSAEETYRAQASAVPRQIVTFNGSYAPGTIVVSTSERRLWYVLGNGQALSYAIAVGAAGYAWSGISQVTDKREWPDWTPPEEMLQRRSDLPRHMAGGPDNPMGARALYLGSTVFRVHGTNQPETIGHAISSGCFRLANGDIIDLYERVPVGTKVVVRHGASL